MNKTQWVSVTLTLGLILLLYFGFDTKPKTQEAIEKSRAFMTESTDIQVLEKDAKAEIGISNLGEILRLEEQLQEALTDSIKVDLYKSLSGAWYDQKQYAIAGYYAQQVAEILQTEESWSIAGTTYTISLQRSEKEKARDFSARRSVQSFESAISVNPENTAHQVNLALVYTLQPPAENPMKGIQMLLGLNKEQPENVLVLVNLGRLAIQTGQLDRAEERLLKVVELEPDNQGANCLLVKVYQEKGETDRAKAFDERCAALL